MRIQLAVFLNVKVIYNKEFMQINLLPIQCLDVSQDPNAMLSKL